MGSDPMDELAFCRLDISFSPLISSPVYYIPSRNHFSIMSILLKHSTRSTCSTRLSLSNHYFFPYGLVEVSSSTQNSKLQPLNYRKDALAPWGMQPNTSTVSIQYPMTCLSSDFYAAYFNLSVNQKQVIPKTYFLLAQAIYWMPAEPIHGGDGGTGCFMDSRVEHVETCRSSTRSTRSTWLNKMFCI